MALSYGPDPGYQKLREEVARWLGGFYGLEGGGKAERICVTGVSGLFLLFDLLFGCPTFNLGEGLGLVSFGWVRVGLFMSIEVILGIFYEGFGVC